MMNMNMDINQMNPNMMPNQFLNNNMNNQFIMNQMNPNIINMNQMYQNFNQINPNMINMNQNVNNININQENEAEDILPYINEPKMILKFSTVSSIKNGTYIAVKLPKSITKNDLYSIAKKYQDDYYSNIILSCNNYLLKEDDTTIEGIEEGSIINIIEDIDFPDGSYYRALLKKNENYEKADFQFKVNSSHVNTTIKFPINITISEMIKGTFSKLLLNSKSTRFADKIYDLTDKISSQIGRIFTIVEVNPLERHWIFGKRININVNSQNTVTIGTLNSIKQLIKQIEFQYTNKELTKLYIGNHEFLINEIGNFSLKSIGINGDVECYAEYRNLH